MKDWDYIADIAVRKNVDPSPIRLEVEAIPDRAKLHSFGPNLYQDYLYALCRIARPSIVVETGTRYGVGSSMILRALDENGHGALYSCDPMHASQNHCMETMRTLHGFTGFDRFTFLPGRSDAVLPRLSTLKEPWSMFVHDSDHSEANMKWELEFALGHLVRGSILVCDDWDWPDEYDDHKQPHRAFEKFCKRHQLAWHTVGTAAVVEI